jgi:excisionase family DNA binding protein
LETLVSVKEAARLLACSEAAIRKWLYERRLPRVKVGRLVRLRLSDLEAFVDAPQTAA